jgi:hypothetical protein
VVNKGKGGPANVGEMMAAMFYGGYVFYVLTVE